MTSPSTERDERRCQHGLPVSDSCDECIAFAEAEESLTLEVEEKQ